MNHSWKLKIYRSWDEVDNPRFIDEWLKWMDNTPDPHVFFHPAMVKVWVDTYRSFQNISPLYCVAEYEDITVFLPLVLWRRNWKNAFLRLIVPVGFSDFDYHDPIVSVPRTNEIMDSFWNLIESRLLAGNLCRYDKISIHGFRFQCDANAWEEGDICPYADLKLYKSYSDYLLNLKKHLRQDIGRQKRRLSEVGETTYKVFQASELAEALALLPDFLAAHSRRWPNDFKSQGFHQAMLKEGVPAGLVHFSVLMVDGIPISWHLGFRYKDRFYYYMPAFLEKYQSYSPSKVHLSYLIEECFDNDIIIFDHLRGSESYKEGWATNAAHLYGYKRSCCSLPATLRLTAFNTMQELKKLLCRS